MLFLYCVLNSCFDHRVDLFADGFHRVDILRAGVEMELLAEDLLDGGNDLGVRIEALAKLHGANVLECLLHDNGADGFVGGAVHGGVEREGVTGGYPVLRALIHVGKREAAAVTAAVVVDAPVKEAVHVEFVHLHTERAGNGGGLRDKAVGKLFRRSAAVVGPEVFHPERDKVLHVRRFG